METFLLILEFLRGFREHSVNLQQEKNEKQNERAVLLPFHVKFHSYNKHFKCVILFSYEK